jgi:hypothetical protein
MKYIKMLGLLAVAAAALMAFAGPASATTVKSTGANYTSTITAESSNSTLHGSFITVECAESHVQGKVESHGAGVTAEGKISNLSFDECNYDVTVKKGGTLVAHTGTTPNGTLTSTGAEITIHTSVGECVFTTSSTPIGTLTGGAPAKLDIDSSSIPRTGGSFFCGSSGEWTGNYTVSVPHDLTLH